MTEVEIYNLKQLSTFKLNITISERDEQYHTLDKYYVFPIIQQAQFYQTVLEEREQRYLSSPFSRAVDRGLVGGDWL